MRIVSREEWGALVPRSRLTKMPLPSPRLWLHHISAEWHGAGGVRQTDAFHLRSRGWRGGIAYSFLVDDDGTVYEGRGAGVAGAHTQGDNSKSHAICAMGDFEKREPPRPMLDSIADLARDGKAKGWWGDVTGAHRDAPGASTACCGRNLYKHLPAIRAAAADTTDQGDDDMALDPELEKMIRDLHKEVTAWDEGGLRWMVGNVHHAVMVDPSALAKAIKAEVAPDVVRQIIEELRK